MQMSHFCRIITRLEPMKRYILFLVFFFAILFSNESNAQHAVGLNFAVGPSLQRGGTTYLATTGEYNYHFWNKLGVGGRIAHVYNQELRNFGSGNVSEPLQSLLISAYVEYQHPLGNLLPYVGTDIGGSIFQREGFYLQPQIGTRAMLTDHWLLDLSVKAPMFFGGPQNYGILFSFGANYRFSK